MYLPDSSPDQPSLPILLRLLGNAILSNLYIFCILWTDKIEQILSEILLKFIDEDLLIKLFTRIYVGDYKVVQILFSIVE